MYIEDRIVYLHRRASIIAYALCMAFGGRSQVSAADIGRAVAGQINNNGLTAHWTIEEVCGAVVDAFDADYDDDTPLLPVLDACRSSLGDLVHRGEADGR